MTAAEKSARVFEETPPIPPRYWWLKRILAAIGLMIVVLIAIRWWWSWDAQRKLQAKIAEHRALGQPVTLEDFQLPPIPDEENAAYFMKEAITKLTQPAGAQLTIQDISSDYDTILANQDDVRRILEANQEAIVLIYRAAHCPESDWDIPLVSPIMFRNLFDYSDCKQLVRLLSAASLYEHAVGNDAAAVRDMRELVLYSNRIFGREGSLIGHLTYIASHSYVPYNIETICPNLKIANDNEPADAARPAQIRELIRLLLDDPQAGDNWSKAFQWKRMAVLDLFQSMGTTKNARGIAPNPSSWLLQIIKPITASQAILSLDLFTTWGRAGVTPDYPAAAKTLAIHPRFSGGIDRIAHFDTLGDIMYSYDRALQLHFRVIALRRLAALALAIKLYEHERRVPLESLRDLVPDYLSEIPVDPFSATREALRYLPNAPRPLLYSISLDGIDQNGQYAFKDNGVIDEDHADLVFFLDGQRPHPAPKPTTTQPLDPDDESIDSEENTRELTDEAEH